MEYRPRYAQPFTLAEAIGLDVSVITDEIARLQISLKHLRETQDVLREYQLTETPDLEVQKALDENEIVIGSQTERISILKMALAEKGVVYMDHYASPDSSSTAMTTARDELPRVSSQAQSTIVNQVDAHQPDINEEDQAEGIHL